MVNFDDKFKLFLGGLHPDVGEDDLKAYFEQFGALTDTVVMRDPATRVSRKFGFVTFSSEDECNGCFAAKPHSIFNKEIDVKLATPKPEAPGRGGPKSRRVNPEILKKLFVGGLSQDTTDEGLKNYLGQFGGIDQCSIVKNPENGRSKGFAFVTFVDASHIDAVQNARPHELDGKTIDTKRTLPKEENSKSSKKIFIGGVKDAVSDEDVESYFKTFGEISSIDMKVDKTTGRKRGFGFVEFIDSDPVDKIILSGEHTINGVVIDVQKALSKEEQMQGGFGKQGMGGGGGGFGSYGGQQGGGGSWNAGASGYAANQQMGGQYGGYDAGLSAGYGGQQGGWNQQQSWQQSPASGWGGPATGAEGWGAGGGYNRVPGGPMRNANGFAGRGGNRSAPYAKRGGRGAASPGGW